MRDFFVVAPVVTAAAFEPALGSAPIATNGGFVNGGDHQVFRGGFGARDNFKKLRIAAQPFKKSFMTDAGALVACFTSTATLERLTNQHDTLRIILCRAAHTLSYQVCRFLSYILGALFHRVK